MSFQLKAESLALLTEQGSLTDLMQSLMGHAPKLKCLTQGKQSVNSTERQILQIAPRRYSHVREIIMGTNSKRWLFARTVIPMETLKGSVKRLAKMNNTPLGHVLFGRINARRKHMWLDLVFAEDAGLTELDIPQNFPLWQRRSVFELASGSLLISEIFLPDSPVYENQQ